MRRTLPQRIAGTKIWQKLWAWLSNRYVDEKKTPVSLVLKILLRKIQNDEISPRANAVAFSLTLSVFPAIIFLFTLIPYIPIPELDTRIMLFLGQVLPEGIYSEIATTIYDIVSRPRSNLLSLGFLFALFAATNGMMSLMQAFNHSYHTKERRGFIRTRLVATGLTVLLAFVLFLAVILLIVGNLVIDWISEHDRYNILNDQVNFFLITLLQYGVVFFVFFITLAVIYYIAPSIQQRWSFFSVGSFISAFLCIISTHLFSYYINNFASYNKLYGSIGTFIGLMIWLFLLSFIILLGFEVNMSIMEAKAKSAWNAPNS